MYTIKIHSHTPHGKKFADSQNVFSRRKISMYNSIEVWQEGVVINLLQKILKYIIICKCHVHVQLHVPDDLPARPCAFFFHTCHMTSQCGCPRDAPQVDPLAPVHHTLDTRLSSGDSVIYASDIHQT